MKTKELIAELMKEDPSGEEQVSVGNAPIYFVCKEESYYDGPLQVLIQDKTKKGWNIVGIKFTDKGSKIVINTTCGSDLIMDRPEIQVDLSELSEGRKERYEEKVKKWKEAGIQMHKDIDMEFFAGWVKKKVGDVYNLIEICNNFYEKNLDYKAEISKDWTKSINERKEILWEETVEVKIEDDKLILNKK